ncbi:unnamed protein product, partial [Polarella glacialis]
MPTCYDNSESLQELCQVPKWKAVERWVPLLILHGELDTVIPPYHGHSLLEEARHLGHPMAEAHFSETATHNRWNMVSDIVTPMLSFLCKHVEGWQDAQDSCE